jgi:hypothetical protein
MCSQDAGDMNPTQTPSALGERLRALPEPLPPSAGWAAMQARMDRQTRQRRHRFAAGFAMAASLLVAVALLWPALPPGEIIESPPQSELARLIGESGVLERELAAARPRVVVWDSRREARVEALQRDLTLVDVQLNHVDAGHQPGQAEALWQRRVALMSQLVNLHEAATPHAVPVAYRVARVD